MKRWQRARIGGLAVAAFLVLWEIAVPLGLAKVGYISRPSLVVKAFGELAASGEVFEHLVISLKEFIIGFILAVGLGVSLGIILGRYRFPALLFDPLLMALYATPRLAMLPLLMVWFGVGLGATVAVVFLSAVFPILVNTSVGIREVDPVWVRAVRSFGGNEWNICTKVLIPGALPGIITGIRQGVGRGLLGMVVGEMYAAPAGIGQQIALYGTSFRTAELIALITIVGLISIISVELLRRYEERVRRRWMEV